MPLARHIDGMIWGNAFERDIADYSDEYIKKKKAKRTLEKAIIFVEDISKEIRNDT
jgi:uncharacterized protein (UPF0332 family)